MSKKENAFHILKKSYIPDLELVYDMLAEITDRIQERYPDCHFEVSGDGNGIRIEFDKVYYLVLRVLNSQPQTGAPAASINLHSERPTVRGSAYNFAGLELGSNTRTFYRGLIDMEISKYDKRCWLSNKEIETDGSEDVVNWLKELVIDVDKTLDKDGKEIRMIKRNYRPGIYDDYDDEE